MMLLVFNPGVKQNTIYQFVETKQVAPTIIQLLGLDVVKLEDTTVLLCLFSTGAISTLSVGIPEALPRQRGTSAISSGRIDSIQNTNT